MRKAALWFAAILTIFVNVSARAGDSQCSMEKLNRSIDAFRGLQKLPSLVASSPGEVQLSQRSLPPEMSVAFDEFQTVLFGKTGVVKLLACDGCEAVAKADAMAVFIDPAFIDELREKYPSDSKMLELFLLAHEISHFVLDYQTLINENGLSICGNIPLMRKGMMDFTDGNVAEMSPEALDQCIIKYASLASASHAEVDAIGILAAKRLGLNLVPAAKALLNHVLAQVSGSSGFGVELTKVDLSKRLTSLEQNF